MQKPAKHFTWTLFLLSVLIAALIYFIVSAPHQNDPPSDPSISQSTPENANRSGLVGLPQEQAGNADLETNDFSDFDSGLSTEWDRHIENGSEAEVSIVNQGLNGSDRAIQVEISKVSTQNLWDIQIVNENNPVDPQTIRIFTAWVKGTKGAEVSFAVETPDYTNIENKAVILVGEWQQVAFEFVSETDVVRTPVHFGSPYNEGATIFVDEIQIR